MSTESRPADVRAASARSGQSMDAVASAGIGPILGAVVTMVLGAALGIADQAATSTPLSLRLPAILAALLMVGQGVVDLKRHWPVRPPRPVHNDLVDDGSGAGPRPREVGSQVARLQTLRTNPVVRTTISAPAKGSQSVPFVLMALSVWLGVADLTVAAPTWLSVLSLVAAFALFALGFSLLPTRR